MIPIKQVYIVQNQYTSRQSYATMYQRCTWLLSIIWTCVHEIFWLSAGYWLAMSHNQYTLRYIIYIPQCIKVAHGCYQYFGLLCVHEIFWLSAGYRLAIGWLCPKINTLQDIYYYVPKWHMPGSNTLACSAFKSYLDM